jgi:two-component system, response regulator PdtaR
MTDSPAEAPARIRLLIAEDDDNARSILVDLLAALGHEVVSEVANGREAVQRALELEPDVVLLDVHMPDGSGIEAAVEITHARPGIAVVLFSGDESVTLSDQDVSATAAIAFLPKPAPPRVLDSTIRLAANRARELASARKDASTARQLLENRKIIERAKGILMKRTGSTEASAYQIMQRTSQQRSVPMVEIAKAILESEPEVSTSASRRGRPG